MLFSLTWRHRRDYQRRIDEVKRAYAASILTARAPETPEQAKVRRGLRSQIKFVEIAKERFESNLILKQASRLGIEVSTSSEKPGWWDDDYEDGMPNEAIVEWLNAFGRTATTKLIRAERRANAEWWLTKIILPVLQVLVPIIALILGVLSVTRGTK